jgi:heterodisulfide reductase subunit C
MIYTVSPSLETEVERRCGEKPRICYQCGKCTTGCLFTFAMDIMPHQVMKLIQYGQGLRLFSSRTIWICASCETCSVRCPLGIAVSRVIDTLREMALEEGVRPAEREIATFHRCFLGNIAFLGRISEPLLMGAYKVLSGDLFSDVGLAAKMLRRGKIRLVPGAIGRRGELRRIFREAGRKEED